MQKPNATFRASLVLLLLLAALPLMVRAQGGFDRPFCGGEGKKSEVTSEGTEFLLLYMTNEFEGPNEYLDIYLASTRDTATVTITCREFPSYSRTIKLQANESQSYRLSNDVMPRVDVSEVVQGRAVRVVSSSPIVCYGMNHRQYSADAWLALPRNTAGMSYRVMSYNNSDVELASYRPSEFGVAAYSDGTQIRITPTAATSGGHLAGVPFDITLDSGQCYVVWASDVTRADLTGTTVEGNKPFVAYGGHVRAEVPVGFTQGGGGNTSRDHLCEQLPPVSTWGQDFITSNFPSNTQGDIVRVLASRNNTGVNVDGTFWVLLQAGEHADRLINGPVVITTTEPCLVSSFAHTAQINLGVGDPFMAIVPPINQTYNDFTFFNSTDAAYDEHHVIIVAEESAVTNVTMDGTAIPSAAFQNLSSSVAGKRYALANMTVAPGIHRIRTANPPESGLTILAYGYGPADSYGYTAGALLKPLRGIVQKNPEPRGTARDSWRNGVDLRNIISEKMYLDSVRITLDGDASSKYTVKTAKRVWQDVDHVNPGEDLYLDLDVTPAPTEEFTGKLLLFGHTASWSDLLPASAEFRIKPVASSSVGSPAAADAFAVNAFPNPFNTRMTLEFTMPTRADLSIRVLDALGRVVRVVHAGELANGPHSFPIFKEDLAAGHYSYEIRSEKLEMTKRGSLIIQ